MTNKIICLVYIIVKKNMQSFLKPKGSMVCHQQNRVPSDSEIA